MVIWRILFLGIEKCKQFFETVDFGKYESLACNWHPAGAFFFVEITILDFLDMQILQIYVFSSFWSS